MGTISNISTPTHKNMSITEEVYHFLNEHRDFGIVSTLAIAEKLKHIRKNNISSALCQLEKRGVLQYLESINGVNQFEILPEGFGDFQVFKGRQNVSHRNVKPGRKHKRRPCKPKPSRPTHAVPREVLLELYNIKETLLDCSARLEKLWGDLK